MNNQPTRHPILEAVDRCHRVAEAAREASQPAAPALDPDYGRELTEQEIADLERCGKPTVQLKRIPTAAQAVGCVTMHPNTRAGNTAAAEDLEKAVTAKRFGSVLEMVESFGDGELTIDYAKSRIAERDAEYAKQSDELLLLIAERDSLRAKLDELYAIINPNHPDDSHAEHVRELVALRGHAEESINTLGKLAEAEEKRDEVRAHLNAMQITGGRTLSIDVICALDALKQRAEAAEARVGELAPILLRCNEANWESNEWNKAVLELIDKADEMVKALTAKGAWAMSDSGRTIGNGDHTDEDYHYEAACSGLRYLNPEPCGDVAAIWINGKRWPIAEHPADEDEPITEDWFENEFASEGVIDYDGWRGVHFEVGCGIYIGVSGKSLLINNCSCSRNQSTRGQLRQLCKALGIELKGSGNG